MIYLDAFLTEKTKILKKTARQNLSLSWERDCRIFTDTDGETAVTFYCLPEHWLKKPDKLKKRLGRILEMRRIPDFFWASPEIRLAAGECLRMPDVGWMRKIRREQPCCEQMAVILPDLKKDGFYRELEAEAEWMEEFLGEDYGRLNGLLLVSCALPPDCGRLSLEDVIPYYGRIYRDTGLPVTCAGKLAFGLPAGRSTVCVNAREDSCVLPEELPWGCLYLDMACGEPFAEERKRALTAAGREICYVSALNFLDTYVRNRYNTYRCKLD